MQSECVSERRTVRNENSVVKTEPTKSTAMSDYYNIIQCALALEWGERKKRDTIGRGASVAIEQTHKYMEIALSRFTLLL